MYLINIVTIFQFFIISNFNIEEFLYHLFSHEVILIILYCLVEIEVYILQNKT